MYVHSVKLENYKSIGIGDHSEIILESRVTAVIGMNGSGKSNVLKGLSEINFVKPNPTAFAESNINLNDTQRRKNWYELVLKPTPSDIKDGLENETTAKITFDSGCEIRGGFHEFFWKKTGSDFEKIASNLESTGIGKLKLGESNQKLAVKYIACMKRTDYLDLYNLDKALAFFPNQLRQLPQNQRDDLLKMLDVVKEKFQDLVSRLPTFYYLKGDINLKDTYTTAEVKDALSAKSSSKKFLCNLVKVLGISSEEFLQAMKAGTDQNLANLREKIKSLIDEKINAPFYQFYSTELINLSIHFDSGKISFMVKSSGGKLVSLSGRSDGLRWMLATFIEAKANAIPDHNVIYLFDEPGSSLHVNAKRELLNLFDSLAEQGNQVVYTTHSPYMLDLQKELHRIRATVKSDTGYTLIYKTPYDSNISADKLQDTLAPIITAMGLNLYDSIGPAQGKVNIVVEGVSDYLYLLFFAQKTEALDLDRFSIIPANGVSNCVQICQILRGWGCKFVALFDYDDAGVKGGNDLDAFSLCRDIFYLYLKNVSDEDIRNATYKSAYTIEDVVTRSEIDRFCVEQNISYSKTLLAKKMCDEINNNQFVLKDEVYRNFEDLFARIQSCAERQR